MASEPSPCTCSARVLGAVLFMYRVGAEYHRQGWEHHDADCPRHCPCERISMEMARRIWDGPHFSVCPWYKEPPPPPTREEALRNHLRTLAHARDGSSILLTELIVHTDKTNELLERLLGDVENVEDE